MTKFKLLNPSVNRIKFRTKNQKISLFIWAIIFLFSSPALIAQQLQVQEKREIQAYRLSADDEFVFDGSVEEAFWGRIEPAADFIQQEPNEGAAATERTEVRIAYDDDYLYIGVILYDSDPSGIEANQRRRDARLVADDRFVWIFDTFNDQRNAYFMEINPNGLRTDGLISTGQGGDINLNWDGIWDARTIIGDFGWSAEIRIPFRTFNFNPGSDRWGANFMRVIRRKSETALWTGFRRNEGITRPQSAGILSGLSGMSQGIGLEVVPFGILRGTEDHLANGRETVSDLDAGFDINYSITPSLRASVTMNTDFAEAEVDQRQVNLTRFPTFFPEQRNFFLEGSNIYEFAPMSRVYPFFSRRIGLREGEPVPITYGARLLGNTGNTNLAILHVRTGESGSVGPEHFSVARIKQNVGSESTLGLIYTRRSSDEILEGGAQPLQDRHTLGADMELGTANFMGDKQLQFQAFFIYHNTPFAADDTTNAWDRSARGFRLNFPNQPWSGHVSYRELGNAFDPAVGFTQRNAFRRLQPSVGYSPQLSGSDLIRQMSWDLWFEHLMDLDFELLTQDIRLSLLDIDFMSDDNIQIRLTRNYERLERPFDIRRDGSIIIPMDEYVNWYADFRVRSASYRNLSVDLNAEYGGFWSGTRTEFGAEITLRPATGIELSPEYIRTYVNLNEGNFTTDLIRFQANLDFTTNLFLTANIQYDNLSNLIGMNNRLRWIITPGSDLYLVYNHNWLEGEDNRFRTLQRSGNFKISYTHRF